MTILTIGARCLSLAQLPATHQARGLQFIHDLQRIKRVPVDVVLDDDDWIDEQLRIVATPGHTKGHLSLYVPAQRTLIANDAVVLDNGKLAIANPQFTLDLKQAVNSVHRLTVLPIERLICYYGGVLDNNIPQHLSALLANYSI